MGWMDRFRKKNDDGDAPGAAPAGSPGGQVGGSLTDADRAAILQMMQQEFAQRGREVVPDGHGGLRGIDGRAFGSANVEAQLTRVPREHWHEVIANHVRIMNTTIDAPGPGSLDEVRDRLYLRLRPESMLPQAPGYDSPALPGIIGMVTIDHPEHTEEMGSIDSLGAGWEEVRAIAIANIRALPPMRHDRVLANDDHPDSAIHVFVTDDFFGPSRFFALDQLLAQIGSSQPAPGVIVAVPHRHMIAIHEVTGQGTLFALNGMVNLAHGQFSQNPGAISPDLFYVAADGRTQQITRIDGTNVSIQIDGPLQEVFVERGIGQG